MDNQIIKRFVPVHTEPTISCVNCGNSLKSSGVPMCDDCIALSVDITSDFPKEGTITFCKKCGRVLVPPNKWIYAERESRELMSYCLKRLPQNGNRIIDASFIWTEPHSRRTKISVTLQGEAKQFNNVVIQQKVVVEFTEHTTQCSDCDRSYTANTWRSCIQVRQKVEHKKTFLYLEQLMLKNGIHKHTDSIKESRDGIDFYFAGRHDAVKMLDFLIASSPVKYKKSDQVVSEDTHTGSKDSKASWSVEIAPICKEDLVVLPRALARQLSNISPLTVCVKVNNNIHLISPSTLQTATLTGQTYWRTPFSAVANARSTIEFMVLDVEPTTTFYDKFVLADITVARSADLGKNDTQFIVRSHLGAILHPGDYVKGYDLTTANFNHTEYEALKQDELPEIVLVKKVYPDKPKKKQPKIKRMAVEYNEDQLKRAPNEEKDYQEFLQDLENDEELREMLHEASDEVLNADDAAETY